MKPAILKDATRIWKDLTKDAKEKSGIDHILSDLEAQLHKKLLYFFQVGDFYYYIFNLQRPEFDFISPDIQKVLGYTPGEMNIQLFLSIVHPEDQPYLVAFEAKMVEFFRSLQPKEILYYKLRFDYRLKRKDGRYVRVLQQLATIDLDENDIVLRTLGIHTDISHIKDEGRPILSFLGMNGRPDHIDVCATESIGQHNPSFTKREREILGYLIEGKTSDEISKQLYLSKYTIDTHRKNLLNKAGCENTSTLISSAIKKGWV